MQNKKVLFSNRTNARTDKYIPVFIYKNVKDRLDTLQ